MLSVPRNPDWTVYETYFRRDALQLLAWGHKDSRSKILDNLEETEITGLISEAIDKRLTSFTTPARFDRYALKEESPIPGEHRTGKRRRRLDITIERAQRGPRPRYIFEAKRLRRNGHTIKTYCGAEGLLRFVQGTYAAEYPEAAMVGYLQSDTPDYWIARLTEIFSGDRQFRISKALTKRVVLRSLADTWVSEHLRQQSNPITLYHVMLVCYSAS
jgi:hypothetical protein